MTPHRLAMLLAGASLAVGLVAASPAGAQQTGSSGLLFAASGENGLAADHAGGAGEPIIASGASVVADGRLGHAMHFGENTAFAWSAPGHILAQRGTLSFFFRPRTPLDRTPFPIFRVGAADGTSWDMAFGRIDWNGHGFDAFVTDTGLARTRVSWRIAQIPAADAWVHIAFAWDEASGVRLWIDGKPVARAERRAVYDSGLFGFGPFQRVVSPHQVHSMYNFRRAGDVDEVRIYDHVLADAAVSALAAGQAPTVEAAPARSLADAAMQGNWWLRYGWTGKAPPYLADPVTRIRRVEFTDTRDREAKMRRGADGIRETTWPGVYNRSSLPGRHDYFELPDWNVYADGGRRYTLTLPDEPWNRVEINGTAFGKLAADGVVLATRLPGLERTTTALPQERRGGTLTFSNTQAETPIEEIGAYEVTPGAVPQELATLSYRVDAGADPAFYPALDALRAGIAGRYPADEQAVAVALPDGAPRKALSRGRGPALPVVHLLVPGDFRDQRPGLPVTRFSYGAENMDGGLDGIAIDLPAMKVAPTHAGLLPLNIRAKDPTWPDRDLLDVNVSVKPGEARSLWLDTRDRLFAGAPSFRIDIAAAGGGFDAAALDGTRIRLIYKRATDARAEHLADRFEQARDNLAFLVEEQPNVRAYPMWTRLEHDISDVLRVDPGNAVARSYWVEKNPEQPYAPVPLPSAPAGVPAWAFQQTQDLKLYRRFVDWWIDHRQDADGEFGGGLSDDTDLVNQWVPLALMGVEPDRLAASQRRVLDATYANGMWSNGLSRIRADELHSYEEGINAVAQSMQLSRGDPTAIERAMAVARNYPRLMQANPAGHVHFVSSYYSGTDIDRDGPLGAQHSYSLLVTHPGLLLVDWNGAPAVKASVLPLLDGWLAHGREDGKGHWRFPSEIDWASDKANGSGVESAAHAFWAAWTWTGDAKYLRPILPDVDAGRLSAVSALNADLIARVPGGAQLASRVVSGEASGSGARIDRNLGGAGDKDVADFIRWQQTGDKAILARLYGAEVEADTQRMHLLTQGELWTDRVSVPSELLQRARLGGVAHLRNAYYPGNLVRWRFAGGVSGEEVAILIPHGDPERFKVIAYNLSDRPVTAAMIGDQLASGRWTMTSGLDADSDDRADAPAAATTVTLEPGSGPTLTFAPHQTAIFDFALATPGDPPSTRPDIGVSADDLALKGGRLAITVHSLGAKPTPAGEALVEDAGRRVLARVRFPALAAPLDLQPKMATINAPLPRGTRDARVRLVLDGHPVEASAANNAAWLGGFIRTGGSLK